MSAKVDNRRLRLTAEDFQSHGIFGVSGSKQAMKELINAHQAHLLMLTILILAPFVGLAWGLWAKRIRRGIGVGMTVGIGNYLLWTLYNALTDKLGLDTVKNLLVNLGLFIALGLLAGAGWGVWAARGRHGGDNGDVA